MKHLIKHISRLLLLIMIIVAATSTNPAAAKDQPLPSQPIVSRIVAHQPQALLYSPSASARRTVSTSLVKVEYQSGGLYVAAKFTANNLKGETIRMALFLGWANGEWLEPNPNAPDEYKSAGGYLTAQTTGTADYTNTEWSYVEFYIPWEYFPSINQNYDVFLQTFVGLDRQDYVASSWKQYFVLYAPTQ